ncbi:MAG: Multidrug resistance protein MdtK [Chlamydiae bacterium]|nr:Multidrug resistance protein MdtK [Chlamydiota bacterium]
MTTNEIQEGSVRQLWKVSASLMISFLSMVAMMFVDRLFLSYYSTDALSAAASAGTLFWAGNFMWITLAAMAEVFVAQYNGAKRYEKLGEPVWQMIYLAGIACLFFFVLAHFGSAYFMESGFMNHHEALYFRWNSYFAPCWILLTALSAFYIGQGKTSIIKWMGLLGNGVNMILDPLLIFGVDGWIPAMGIKGAAIATAVGIVVQVVILYALFLHPKNQADFGTGNAKFRPKAFFGCLRVGISPAIFVLFELLGWAAFYMMMERISTKHILVASVTQSILILFMFFGFALEKGAAAVSGNLIGANKLAAVTDVFKSGIKLTLLFSLFLLIILGGLSDTIMEWFFINPEALSSSTLGISPEMMVEVKGALRTSILLLIVYMTLENIRWLVSGILTSAGDTFFLMITGSTSIWLFMLVPTYFLVVRPKASIELAFYIWIFYSVMSSSLLIARFFHGKWKEKHLIEEEEEEPSLISE